MVCSLQLVVPDFLFAQDTVDLAARELFVHSVREATRPMYWHKTENSDQVLDDLRCRVFLVPSDRVSCSQFTA